MTTDEITRFFEANPDLTSVTWEALDHYTGYLERPKQPWETQYIGFEYYDLPSQPAPVVLTRLRQAGVLKIAYKSRKSTHYAISQPEEAREALEMVQRGIEAGRDDRSIPGDLFGPIVGYEEAKELFYRVINAERPVHILMVGPPASAKTVF